MFFLLEGISGVKLEIFYELMSKFEKFLFLDLKNGIQRRFIGDWGKEKIVSEVWGLVIDLLKNK